MPVDKLWLITGPQGVPTLEVSCLSLKLTTVTVHQFAFLHVNFSLTVAGWILTHFCTIINYSPPQWPQIAWYLGRKLNDTHKIKIDSELTYVPISQSETSTCVFTHNMKVSRDRAQLSLVVLLLFHILVVQPIFSVFKITAPYMWLPSLALPGSFESQMLAFTFPTTLQVCHGDWRHLIKPLPQCNNQRKQGEDMGHPVPSTEPTKCHQMYTTCIVVVNTMFPLSDLLMLSQSYLKKKRNIWSPNKTTEWLFKKKKKNIYSIFTFCSCC